MSAGGFVFAVCGGEPQLARLEEALGFLAAFASRPVTIVTDPRRNPRPIPGARVVEVDTPAELDDRAAAIWLKTSLPELLPGVRPELLREGAPFCYLDSDVLAVSPEVDRIFDFFVPPATFASDLPSPATDLRRFSRHAVACPCREEGERLERFFARLDALTALHGAQGELAALDDPAYYRGARFEGERRRGQWWRGVARAWRPGGSLRFEQEFVDGEPVVIRYSFPGTPWRLEKVRGDLRGVWRDGEGHFRWTGEGARGYWEDERGDSFRRLPTADGGEEAWWFRAGAPRRRWVARPDHDHGGVWLDPAGGDLGECDHLAEAIEDAFGVAIPDRRWVPWNGGVFLFDPRARPLFARWRAFADAIRDDPRFVPRDQGALIAAAHAEGLAGHPRLPGRFNRIVDRRTRGAADLATLLDAERAAFLHLIDGGLGGAPPALGAALAAHRAARRPRRPGTHG